MYVCMYTPPLHIHIFFHSCFPLSICFCVWGLLLFLCFSVSLFLCVWMGVSVQTAIVAGGGVEVIVAAMRTHAGDRNLNGMKEVGEEGCWVLRWLAADHAGNQVGVHGGGAPREGKARERGGKTKREACVSA